MKKIDSTIIVTDIRNFTGICEEFETRGSEIFMLFMERYYEIHMMVAHTICKNVTIWTTGDGIITMFNCTDHHKKGYAFALAMYRALSYNCDRFTKDTGVELSFGIGCDSGFIRNIDTKYEGISIGTPLGPVINRASRIETATKMFHHTNMAIGGNIYKALMEQLCGLEVDLPSFYKMINKDTKAVLASRELLVYYIFDYVLKGVKSPLPIFRLDPELAFNDRRFWRLMLRLVGKNKCNEILDLTK